MTSQGFRFGSEMFYWCGSDDKNTKMTRHGINGACFLSLVQQKTKKKGHSKDKDSQQNRCSKLRLRAVMHGSALPGHGRSSVHKNTLLFEFT